MRLLATITAVLMLVATGSAQTAISDFPYFYDWSGPSRFVEQPDQYTYVGGDGHWGTYVVAGKGAPQFDSSITVPGQLASNRQGASDTLFIVVDASGRTFNGTETFSFDASRSGKPGPIGTMCVYANTTLIKTIDVATGLTTSLQTFSAVLPQAVGNSMFTLYVIVSSNVVVRIDNTAFSGGALPITLGSFTLSPAAGAVVLNWRTVTETDNYGFFVQKSGDGNEWADIPLSFQAGHGTTVVPQSYSYADTSKPFGRYYRLRQIDLDGTNHYSDAVAYAAPAGNESAGSGFVLNQCYPNPFNPRTTISFRLSKEGHAALMVYNIIGEEVATLVNQVVPAGEHSVAWDPMEKSSGTYFCVLRAEGKVEVRRMLYVK